MIRKVWLNVWISCCVSILLVNMSIKLLVFILKVDTRLSVYWEFVRDIVLEILQCQMCVFNVEKSVTQSHVEMVPGLHDAV